MKYRLRGIGILILFLVGFPLILDIIISLLVKTEQGKTLSISSILFSGYIILLPKYIYHVALGFAITLVVMGRKKKIQTEQANEKVHISQ